MAKFKLSLYQKQQIEMMFFGPYDESWLDVRGRIDNTDEKISERTGLPLNYISSFIDELISERNKKGKPIFIECDTFKDHVILTLESKINEEIAQESLEAKFDNFILPSDDDLVNGILSLPN